MRNQQIWKPTVKLEPFYSLTAHVLDLPKSKVKNVVEHQFYFVQQWMKYPIKPAVQLPEFGTFELKVVGVERYINTLLTYLRDPEYPKKEEAATKLKRWWPLRIEARKYLKSKKRPKMKARVEKLIKEHEQQTKS